MNADEYQEQAKRTLVNNTELKISDKEMMLVWNAIGLAGEAGEVNELIKKGVFHQHGVDHDKLIKELGDVLWYTAALCSVLGVPMSEVMELNISKLKARYPYGFTPLDSLLRVDAKEGL